MGRAVVVLVEYIIVLLVLVVFHSGMDVWE